MKQKTAAAYIRVSTESQTELSPDSQIKLVKQYALNHGYALYDKYIYRDDGISGRTAEKRPNFNLMISEAKQKPPPFCAVLLWKFSRFARNQEESIFYKSMLRKNGIEVISVSEPITEGPFGSLIERIIEWSDEYYSIRLSGEVKRGMSEKVERGGAVSVAPFGYTMKNKEYQINPETSYFVRKMFDDYLNGVPVNKIAEKLNELKVKTTRGNSWESRTVEYILRNPVYMGKIRWNPKRKTGKNYDDPDIIISDGRHQPIIDSGLFYKVQTLIEKNSKNKIRRVHEKTAAEYMLHGLLKCSSCGSALSMAQKGKSLQCIAYAHGKCRKSHSVTLEKINAAVISALEKAVGNRVVKICLNKQSKRACINENEMLLQREQNRVLRIKDAYENGVYSLSEYSERKSLAEERIDRIKRLLKSAESEQRKPCSPVFIKFKLIDMLESKNYSEKEKNIILSSFTEKIIFDRASSSIELYFSV